MSGVKGTGVAAVLEYLLKTYKKEGIERLRAGLSPQDQQLFDRPIAAVEWIDFGYYTRMIVAADRILGSGDFQVVEAAARYNMRKNYRGIFQFFANALSPKFMINRANTMWRQWFNSGWMEPEWLGEKHAVIILREFEDMPPFHEHNLTPSIDEVMKITGGRNTVCRHIRCVLHHADTCAWECIWE